MDDSEFKLELTSFLNTGNIITLWDITMHDS